MSTAQRIGVTLLLAFAAVAADTADDLTKQAEQLIRSGDRGSALAVLAKASSIAANSAETEDQIGFLYAVLQQSDDSIAHFERSINLNSSFAPAHYHLGVALWNIDQQSRALPELEAAVRLDPKSFDYRYRLGSAYVKVSEVAKAIPELQEATAIRPSDANAAMELSSALQAKGDLAGASRGSGHGSECQSHRQYVAKLLRAAFD